MSIGPGKKTKHHRKPESLGGTKTKRNLSFVPLAEHRAWHRLFDNLPADAIPKTLTKILEQRAAWKTLFGDKPLEEVIEVINETWIDPDYRITHAVEAERVRNVRIMKRK